MRRVFVIASALSMLALPPLTSPATAAAPRLRVSVVRSGLEVPWDVAFTPGGRMVVTERPGRIRVYSDGTRSARLLSTTVVPRVRAEFEAGLMGVAVTRRRDTTYVVVCASRSVSAGWRNQVLRYRMKRSGALRFEEVILGRMRANTYHNGCAVEIGPDRKVWVTMGDAGDLSLPQNRSSRNGKVLRIKLKGGVPRDNPFRGSPVYAVGLRNPQGIAFEPGTGRAFSIEHGPDVHDEINRVRPGRNYGWPCWTGRATRGPSSGGCRGADSYVKPAWSSGGSTIATSGGAFTRGRRWRAWRKDLFVATLKESDLRRFEVGDAGKRAFARSTLFNGRWGRLRGVTASPNGRSLYLTTSNGGSSDRIIRIRARR